jgi:GNAT superfamily N-acetyltransferase
VAALAERLNRHFGIDAPAFGAAAIEPLLGGPRPFLYGFLAERAGAQTREAVGYALAQDFFDTDTGRMAIWLLDLYIEPDCRGAGLGRALIARLAGQAAAEDRAMISLAVYRDNPARRLYERIGAALPEEALVYELRGEALDRLARDAESL